MFKHEDGGITTGETEVYWIDVFPNDISDLFCVRVYQDNSLKIDTHNANLYLDKAKELEEFHQLIHYVMQGYDVVWEVWKGQIKNE